jgi:hypothetical protein
MGPPAWPGRPSVDLTGAAIRLLPLLAEPESWIAGFTPASPEVRSLLSLRRTGYFP